MDTCPIHPMMGQAEEARAMHKSVGANRLRAGLGVAVALLGVFFLGVLPAEAGIGGSATPTYPPTATVGDNIPASVLIVNTSTPNNDTETVNLTTLFVTPACASATTSVCLDPNLDPGIFKVLSAVGAASTTPCSGVTFTVS